MCLYLYVSVGEQQVHDDVLREDLSVVDAEFDAWKLLRQLLSLVLLSGLPDVIQQGVLKGGTAADRKRSETEGGGDVNKQIKRRWVWDQARDKKSYGDVDDHDANDDRWKHELLISFKTDL